MRGEAAAAAGDPLLTLSLLSLRVFVGMDGSWMGGADTNLGLFTPRGDDGDDDGALPAAASTELAEAGRIVEEGGDGESEAVAGSDDDTGSSLIGSET